MKKIKLNIQGLHCKSCKTLLETELDILKGVKNVEINYQKGIGKFEFDEEIISENKIKKEIKKLGYSADKNREESNISGGKASSSKLVKFFISLALIIVIFGYFIVSHFGGVEILARLNDGGVGYSIIFIIGLLAGFHCVGMCGGFVLAYSTNHPKNKNKVIPHLQYNFGRIISYTIIGGILGGLGSFFGINPVFSGVVLLVASIFMILMGLSFMFNLQILEKIKLRTPQFVARYLYRQKQERSKGPLLIGLLNGLMPCGPLQAVQLYALTTGNALQGALSLGIYALGTAIMMFFFGLTVSTINAIHIKKMVKISGFLVLFLGILMTNRGLASFGLGFTTSTKVNNIVINNQEDFQEVFMDLTYSGYSPNVLYIKKDLTLGENIIEFTPPENVSEIKFSCWMRMVWGRFVMVDNNNSKDIQDGPGGFSSSDGCGGDCISCGLITTCELNSGGGCGCQKQ